MPVKGDVIDKAKIKAGVMDPSLHGIDGLKKLYRRSGHAVIRHLIALTYDKGDALAWRAIAAVGKLSGLMPPEKSRALVQRILWMMRDESGGNAWSGPELIGAIVAENPAPLADIVPVLFSFHEEEIFRTGVLWAMAKIAASRADLVRPLAEQIARYIDHPDPSVRENAREAIAALAGGNGPLFRERGPVAP